MSAEREEGEQGNERRCNLSADARRQQTEQRHNLTNNAAVMPLVAVNNTNQNSDIVVRASGLNSYVPTIRRVNKANIKAKLPHQHLTPIEGKPTYDAVQNLEEELVDNALTAKVRFREGKKGSLGVVYNNAKFCIESGGTN